MDDNGPDNGLVFLSRPKSEGMVLILAVLKGQFYQGHSRCENPVAPVHLDRKIKRRRVPPKSVSKAV
jgi:hypothetical protein